MDRLDEIRARLAAATPGPWKNTGTGVNQDAEWWYSVEDAGGEWVYDRAGVYACREQDADFIAHAPTDMAYLLDEVARLLAELRAARELRTATLDWHRRHVISLHMLEAINAMDFAYRASAAPAESERGEGTI